MPQDTDQMTQQEIEKYLKGVNFPAKKEELIQVARKNNAPDNVLQGIRSVEGDRFQSSQDVTRELSKRH